MKKALSYPLQNWKVWRYAMRERGHRVGTKYWLVVLRVWSAKRYGCLVKRRGTGRHREPCLFSSGWTSAQSSWFVVGLISEVGVASYAPNLSRSVHVWLDQWRSAS